ncbi:uncharacterized protein LOC110037833 isoform X2 [Phalaenopsis equestris]|uniref:uncharacterized protein LOC110037833 isoform X2 n=1 Tax=Phalaenopsis equestris TaxID=78828 RepID=UPI0009E4CD52|nr:uncharacterized protein LOC110037833 isoform X2 [Phalaenopsis equestris]
MDVEDPSSQLAEPLAATGNSTAVDGNVDLMNSDKAESICHREGCEALARAISSTLGALISEFDSTAGGASRSQDDLYSTIDRLTGELDKLLEDAPSSFILQNAAKITSVRRRVSALNLVLKSIQRRLDNIDRMLFTNLPEGAGMNFKRKWRENGSIESKNQKR